MELRFVQPSLRRLDLLVSEVIAVPIEEMVRPPRGSRSEEHTSELQSREKLVCRLLLGKKNEIDRDNLKRGGRGVRLQCTIAALRRPRLVLADTADRRPWRAAGVERPRAAGAVRCRGAP